MISLIEVEYCTQCTHLSMRVHIIVKGVHKIFGKAIKSAHITVLLPLESGFCAHFYSINYERDIFVHTGIIILLPF